MTQGLLQRSDEHAIAKIERVGEAEEQQHIGGVAVTREFVGCWRRCDGCPIHSQASPKRITVLYHSEGGYCVMTEQIGRAHVCTPVTNAHIVCRLLLEKKNTTHRSP